MNKTKETDAPSINGDPVVMVRLSQVAEPFKSEITAVMLAKQERARALRAIKGDAHRTAAFAQPMEGEAFVNGVPTGRMERKDEPAPTPPTKVQGPLIEIVDAGREGGPGRDSGITDGSLDEEHRADTGEFIRKPQPLPARY